MSAELSIPMPVWDAVLDATKDAPFESREHQQRAVEAAAPLIVAAELERLAAGIDGVPDPAGDAWLKAETAGRREVKRALQTRAAELRGDRKAEQR